jgi:hypothetical protein
MKTGPDLIMNPGHFQMRRPRLPVVVLLAYTHFEQPQGARPSSSLLEVESRKQIMKPRVTAAKDQVCSIVQYVHTALSGRPLASKLRL